MNFKNKIVNDLAWVIGSAPLMSFSPKSEAYPKLVEEWFTDELNRCIPFLLKLDANPEHLEVFLSSDSKQFLGKRFELFVEYWLRHSEGYELIICNKQLVGPERTVGEIDFVFKHLESGELWHIEVACKYYLGHDNSSQWQNWVGINSRDSLKNKMNKFESQLDIFSLPEGKLLLQSEQLSIPTSFLFMKGFFFYHWLTVSKAKSPSYSAPGHNCGVYLKTSEMNDFFSAHNSWVVLSKRYWFSEFSTQNQSEVFSELTIKSKVKEILNKYNFGVMLARVNFYTASYNEDLRVVVVPDTWPG